MGEVSEDIINKVVDGNGGDGDDGDEMEGCHQSIHELIVNKLNQYKQDQQALSESIDAAVSLLNQKKDDKNMAEYYDAIYHLLNDGEKGLLKQCYDDIYWDFVNGLIQSLNSSSSTQWSPLNPLVVDPISCSILKVLDWISINSSAREFLLVVQELDASSFYDISFYTKISLIGLIKNALKKIDIEKRYIFLKSLIPSIIDIIPNGNQQQQQQPPSQQLPGDEEEDGEDDDEDEEDQEEESKNGPITIIGQDQEEELQQKNSDNDTKWEYPLSSILDFIYSLSIDLKIQEPINGSNQSKYSQEVLKQHHLFLQSLFQIMGKDTISSTPQPLNHKGLPIIVGVSEILNALGVTYDYILNTDTRYRLKRREFELEDMYFDQGLEDEDLFDEEEEEQDTQGQKEAKQQQKNVLLKNNNDDGEEEEDDEDDDDEEDDQEDMMMMDMNLNYQGIGYYFYHLLLRPTEVFKLPSVISPSSLLMNQLPFLITMLQSTSYKVGFKSIQILSFLQKRIKPSSIKIEESILKLPTYSLKEGDVNDKWLIEQTPNELEVPYHLLQLYQCSIGFMVKCPVQTIRTFAFQTLGTSLSMLTASTRYHLLSLLISNCIFPSFTGLLINMLKQQIDIIWNGTSSQISDDEKAYFLSPKLLDLISIPMHAGGNLLERMDSIMNSLNLYRYLLIKDRNEKRTGVWSKGKLMGIKDQFLAPLVNNLVTLKEQYISSANGDQEALRNALKQVSKLGVDQMNHDDIQRASQLVIHHIDLAIDVVERIYELQNQYNDDN